MSRNRQQMQDCLEQVAAYRASGQKAKEWAQAHGMSLHTLASWCTHSRRWQARLDGGSIESSATPRPSGFVAARVGPSTTSTSVRVELTAGGARLDLHWPLAHTRELAALVRELSR